MRKKKDPDISDIVTIVKREGYRVYPTAQRQVSCYIKKAQKSGVIRTNKDSTICAAALISFGVETAIARNASNVKVGDINLGARMNRMAMGCPGNTPPHRCFSTTVLSSVSQLRDTKPLFAIILDETLENYGDFELDV
jgi:hypothetical protein